MRDPSQPERWSQTLKNMLDLRQRVAPAFQDTGG
jgi:hypothetical protein